jgi:hypothetical protein
MDVVICDHHGNRTLTLTEEEISQYKDTCNVRDHELCKQCIRRDIDILCKFQPSTITFFSSSLQICLEHVLRKRLLDKHEMFHVDHLINAYEEFSRHMKSLPSDLSTAVDICLSATPTLSGVMTKGEIRTLMRAHVYPRCNIKTMCFLHQLWSRVVCMHTGDVTLVSDTFMDRVCNQIWTYCTYFSEFSQEFPLTVLNLVTKDLETQIGFYQEWSIQQARTQSC